MSLVSAVPLIVFSVGQLIGYDGYWHVFIARQDTWQNFWLEVRENAHPPLFYFVLGRMLVFGKTALVYRMLGISAAIGSSYLVGRIVRRCGASAPIAMLVSAAFAVSSSTLLIGVEVRAYMLATFFCLIAFRGFLDLMAGGFGQPARTARLWFGVGMMLALFTHYSAAFVLAACIAVPLYLSVFSRDYRRRAIEGLRSRAAANAVTLALPIAGLLAVAGHSIGYSGRLNHVPEFLHDPARESATAFVADQTSNLAAMFVPFATGQGAQNVMALALAAFSVLALPLCIRGRTNLLSWVPLLATATIGTSLALAGVLRRYPYGGELRHQYVLFPFLVLTIGVAFGSVGSWAREGWRRASLTVLLGLVVVVNASGAVRRFPWTKGRLVQGEMDRFRTLVPFPRAVYLDQFNLIVFSMHYDDWDWSFSGRSTGRYPIDLWRLSRGDQSFHVCRDRFTWMVNLAEPRVYQSFNDCAQLAQSEKVALFALEQPSIVAPIPAGTIDPEVTLKRRADEAGLALTKLQLDRGNVFVEFTGAAPAPSTPSDARKSISP